MEHLKRLGTGLSALSVFATVLAMVVGLIALVVCYPFVGVPILVLGLAYGLGEDIRSSRGVNHTGGR